MQTTDRFAETLQKLLSLTPDRIALFGYAHVPWMARRQKMIDHFALPNCSMTLASQTGMLFRNFLGYTTDPSMV